MSKFKKIDTSIEGVYVIEPTVFGDNRGYFMETYSKGEFKEIGLNSEISLFLLVLLKMAI